MLINRILIRWVNINCFFSLKLKHTIENLPKTNYSSQHHYSLDDFLVLCFNEAPNVSTTKLLHRKIPDISKLKILWLIVD